MKVCVLMSSYNGEAYIEQQIESILAQQCDAQVTLLVRDDGSTDTTRDILQRYCDAGKLQWYTGENLRSARSFLDLVKNCPEHDYYAFCDQDDVWYPDKLEASIRLLQGQDRPAMVYANARLVDGQLNPIGRNVYTRIPPLDYYSVVCGGGILGCTMVFNHRVAQLIQAYPSPEKLIMHDYYCAILCTLFDGVVLFDLQPHMDYRQHGNNVVGTNWTKWDALRDRISRITKRPKVTIAQQAQSILDQAPQPKDAQKLAFLRRVAAYPDSFVSALSLACSPKPRYNGKNRAITLRLAILFRNR